LTTFSKNLTTPEQEAPKKDLVILSFQAGAEINNLDELAKIATKWNQDFIAFASLTKENDTNFRIESVERGSIILTLSAVSGIVIAFAKATNMVLDVIKKCYEIKKLANEARLLKGVPEKAIQELDNSSKIKVRTESMEITRQLIGEYEWDQVEQRKDVDAHLRIAIKHLLEFVNVGGKVDVKLLAPEQNGKQLTSNLSIKYQEIKKIENEISSVNGEKQILELTEGDISEDSKDAEK
jgi:hypothetical protein